MSWSPADGYDDQGNHHPGEETPNRPPLRHPHGGRRMMTMCPTDAQLILKGAEFSGEDLGIGYRRALETCAGMREEWGIVAVYLGRHEVEEWGFDTREDALDEASALDLDELRIVRRYVTTPEEA